MTKLMKYCLLPILIVASIAAIAVNVYYHLIKRPATGEAIIKEKQLPRPEKIR